MPAVNPPEVNPEVNIEVPALTTSPDASNPAPASSQPADSSVAPDSTQQSQPEADVNSSNPAAGDAIALPQPSSEGAAPAQPG